MVKMRIEDDFRLVDLRRGTLKARARVTCCYVLSFFHVGDGQTGQTFDSILLSS